MQRAIELSKRGLGKTKTNPLVGCVIVHDDKIIGEGWHTMYGAAHAEVEAVKSVSKENKNLLSESTLYVTLEPCCHFGKTPPCTDLIIENKIPKVVIASKDPFEKVSGKGIEKLRNANINVSVGLLREEAEFVNRRFIVNQTQKRPYIILKWAETKDGFISGKTEKKISGNLAQLLLHKWRSEESAFLIGKNTLVEDNPMLNNRLWTGGNPARIVLGNTDSSFSSLDFFKLDIPTFVIGNSHKVSKIQNAEIVNLDSHNLNELMKFTFEKGLSSIVIEGGREVLNSFINKGFWDEARVFISKEKEFKEGIKSPDFSKEFDEVEDLKEDILNIKYNNAV